jgi:hypothetical protein
MILPNKNITLSNSLLGMGSSLLTNIQIPQTLSSLWEKIGREGNINSYEKFILCLDLLYILDLIEFQNGIIKRVTC